MIPSHSINYSNNPVGHAFPQFLKVCLQHLLTDLGQDFSQPCFHFIRLSLSFSNIWEFPMKPALEIYPDTLDGVEVWGIGWLVLHLDAVFLKKNP